MKFSQRFRGELVLSLARTFIARAIAALGSLLLLMVLGRLYGPTGVGVFALAQSVYLGAGILARYGMDNSLMRYVGQDHTSGAIKTYLRWAISKSLVISVLAACLVFLLRHSFATWFEAPGLAGVLPGIALTIPGFTVAFVLGGFMKGIRKPATACLLENGSISLIASGLVLMLHLVTPQGIANAGWAMALAAWFVLGQGAWQAWRWFDQQDLKTEVGPVRKKEFTASSQAFFVMSLAQFMQNVISVLVAGWLLGSDELGLFRSAERTAMLINFILIVINAVFPPRFARLYHKGDMQGLSALARKGVLLGLVLSSPMLLVCMVVPQWVLSLFGPEFSEAGSLLRVIAIAQMVNVATGSVNFLLNMTGHEKLMRNIALSANTLGLVMFFVLIPPLGPIGAALGLALVLVLQNLIALIFVWRKLGIWVLPTPNFLKLMSVDSQKAI